MPFFPPKRIERSNTMGDQVVQEHRTAAGVLTQTTTRMMSTHESVQWMPNTPHIDAASAFPPEPWDAKWVPCQRTSPPPKHPTQPTNLTHTFTPPSPPSNPPPPSGPPPPRAHSTSLCQPSASQHSLFAQSTAPMAAPPPPSTPPKDNAPAPPPKPTSTQPPKQTTIQPQEPPLPPMPVRPVPKGPWETEAAEGQPPVATLATWQQEAASGQSAGSASTDNPWAPMVEDIPPQIATAARLDGPWDSMVGESWAGVPWVLPPTAVPLQHPLPLDPPVLVPVDGTAVCPSPTFTDFPIKAPPGTDCRERQLEFINAGKAVPRQFSWIGTLPRIIADVEPRPGGVGLRRKKSERPDKAREPAWKCPPKAVGVWTKQERRQHPAGARPDSPEAARPTTLQQSQEIPIIHESIDSTLVTHPALAVSPESEQPPTTSDSNEFLHQIMVARTLQPSECDETASVISAATSFDTHMLLSAKRWSKSKMDAATALQHIDSDEDEAVCLNYPLIETGRMFLPASSSTDVIPMQTPATQAVTQATRAVSPGCVPGKNDVVPVDPSDSGSSELMDGPDPKDVAIPSVLSVSPTTSLSLAAMALVQSPEAQMPKATKQIELGLRPRKEDDDIKWV